MEVTKKELGHVTAYEVAKHSALRPVLLYFAIARNGDDALRLLHIPLGYGEEALVVFSSWEAAQRYFLREVFSGEWYARECSGGELVSLLLGPYEGIEWVLLDPLPRSLTAGDDQTNLISRQRFVDYLLGWW
jgi:hypothetical protein